MAINIGTLLMQPSSWIIVALLLLAILYSLRSYFGALLYALPLDGLDALASDLFPVFGDAAASIAIFLFYRKKIGNGWAAFLFLEANNFFAEFWLPGIGAGLAIFFNFFPAITLVVLLKQWQANQIYQPVKEYYEYLDQEAPEIAKRLKPEYEEAKELYESYAYLTFEEKGPAKKEALFLAIKEVIEERLIAAEQQLSSLPQQEAQQYQQRIQAVKDEIDTDWRDAASYAQELEQQISSRATQMQNTKQAV
ncbi:hypothetical protein HZA99_05560 [Candidatus Woesearchaeota archaeon]|nr:hypothetical protein [Candidatus Woesearchaeota archaeon]